jgi:hypothetical protein
MDDKNTTPKSPADWQNAGEVRVQKRQEERLRYISRRRPRPVGKEDLPRR